MFSKPVNICSDNIPKQKNRRKAGCIKAQEISTNDINLKDMCVSGTVERETKQQKERLQTAYPQI